MLVCRVSEEKEARGYLQALAGKMTDELDQLKGMNMTGDENVSSLPYHAPVYFSSEYVT